MSLVVCERKMLKVNDVNSNVINYEIHRSILVSSQLSQVNIKIKEPFSEPMPTWVRSDQNIQCSGNLYRYQMVSAASLNS